MLALVAAEGSEAAEGWEAVDCSQHLGPLSNTSSRCRALLMSGQVHAALHSVTQHDRATHKLKSVLCGASSSTLGAANLAVEACRQRLSRLRSTNSQWQ